MRRLVARCVGVALLLSSCDQKSVTSPESSRQPASPAFNQDPPSGSGTLGVASVTDPSASADLPTYPDPTFVEVRINGAIGQYTENGYYANYPRWTSTPVLSRRQLTERL